MAPKLRTKKVRDRFDLLSAFWRPICDPLLLMKYQNQASGRVVNLVGNKTKELKMHMLSTFLEREDNTKKQKNKIHFVSWDMKQLQELESKAP